MKIFKMRFTILFFFLSFYHFGQVLNVTINTTQNVLCNGMCNGSLSATATGGSGSYIYSWSNGSTASTITGLCAGTYSVIVDDGLTQDTATAVLSQPPPIAISINSPSPVCLGNTVSVCAAVTGGVGAYSYNWSPPNGLSSPTVLCPIFTGTASTTYTLTVVDANGCVATATTNLIVNSVTPSATNTGPYCVGNTVQLSSSGGTSYLWTGPNGFTSNLANPVIINSTGAASGVYTVTVTANGCSATATTSISVTNPPTVAPFVSNPICSGSNLVFNAGTIGAVNYLWTGPNGFSSTQQNPVIYNAQPIHSGVYTLTATNSSGCIASGTVTLVVSAGPSVSIATLIEPSCGINDGVLMYTATGGSAPYLYSGNACGAGNFGPFTSSTISNICSGMASLVVMDANGCTDTLTVPIADSCDLTWPGDANDDLIADNLDALEIGLGAGLIGTPRLLMGNTWNKHNSLSWGNSVNGLTDDKHIDCDGNGIIELTDTNAIILNYGLTRPASRITLLSTPGTQGGNYTLSVDVLQDTLFAGGNGNISMKLGDSLNPISNFYGLAFTLNFDPAIIDPSSFSMNANGSWAGIQNTNLFCLKLDDGVSGMVKGVVSRYDHNNMSGFGLLANLGFKLTNNFSGSQFVSVSLSNLKLIDKNNQAIGLNALNDSIFASSIPLGSSAYNISERILIYPNPVSENITLSMNHDGNYTLTIYDMLGKKADVRFYTGMKSALEFKNLEPGMYLLQVEEKGEVIYQGKILKN